MPVLREPMSLSMFAELLSIEPARFCGCEFDRRTSTVTLVLEPEENMQTSGTCPPLSDSTGKRKPRKK
jgi:hypothetical protein